VANVNNIMQQKNGFGINCC